VGIETRAAPSMIPWPNFSNRRLCPLPLLALEDPPDSAFQFRR
jgi:hypothetical protein